MLLIGEEAQDLEEAIEKVEEAIHSAVALQTLKEAVKVGRALRENDEVLKVSVEKEKEASGREAIFFPEVVDVFSEREKKKILFSPP